MMEHVSRDMAGRFAAVPNLSERFEASVERIPFSGCWIWMGSLNSDGYGQLCLPERRYVRAHRLAWEMFNGPILGAALVCHRCDVPSCVNPDHLWLGSNRANMLDAGAKGRLGLKLKYATHCKRGHEFTPENTGIRNRPNGGRWCRACSEAWSRVRRNKEAEVV